MTDEKDTLQEQVHLYRREPVKCDPRGYGYVIRRALGPRLSDNTCLSYVEKGSGYFTIYNRKWTIQAGDLFLVPPDVLTAQRADEDSDLHIHWVAFNTNVNTAALASNPILHAPEAKAIFQTISQYNAWSEHITLMLSSDICQLLRLYLDRDDFSQKSYDTQEYCIRYIRDTIHTHYDQNIQFAALAEQLYVHKSYLSAAFKKHIGISPRQYLTAYRIYRGALLLLYHPTASASHIADKVGYNDVSNFRKAFFAHLHLTPTQFHALNDREKQERIATLCQEYALPEHIAEDHTDPTP